MKVERVVFDTNVLISAAISKNGPPARSLRLVLRGHARLAFSAPTFAVVKSRLSKPKFDKYVSKAARREFPERIFGSPEPVMIDSARFGCRDPQDDMILETALVGEAEAVVTGDRDLLVMHPFQDIPVLTRADFLTRTEEASP